IRFIEPLAKLWAAIKASSACAMTSTIALPMPTTSIGAELISTKLQAGRRKAAEYRGIARPHNPHEAPLRDRRDLPAPSICAVLSGIAPSQAAKSLIYFRFLPHSRFKKQRDNSEKQRQKQRHSSNIQQITEDMVTTYRNAHFR